MKKNLIINWLLFAVVLFCVVLIGDTQWKAITFLTDMESGPSHLNSGIATATLKASIKATFIYLPAMAIALVFLGSRLNSKGDQALADELTKLAEMAKQKREK